MADWEKRGFLKAIITQNVSGLHQLAGSSKVIELHGNLRDVFCHHCGQKATVAAFRAGQACDCGGQLRPGVVLFGEALPENALSQAMSVLAQADFIFILGSSLQVYPAANLPFIFPMKRCYVDLMGESVPGIDFVFQQKIGDFLIELDQQLNTANKS